MSGQDGIRAVGAYVGKYISKTEQSDTGHGVKRTGRQWGIWNKPHVQSVSFRIPIEDAKTVSTALLALAGYEKDPYEWFSIVNNTVYTGDVGTAFGMAKTLAYMIEQGYTISTVNGSDNDD